MAGRERSVVLAWSEALADYDFGPGHPLAPVRVELTVELIRACGLTAGGSTAEIAPLEVSDEQLQRIHAPGYVEAVRRCESRGGHDALHGLGPGDNPVFAGMHEASARVCGATLAAAREVWEGRALHGFSPAGGLHHAMPDRASGFCVYNDPAFAIDWLLRQGAERVCYVDVDVHHGDGVERIFWNDPRVLTISVHESGRYLFPGSGRSHDTGGEEAPGSAANLPLHPGTPGDLWLEVVDEAVVPLVRAYGPELLVTQLGCDGHVTDPLAHLALTLDTYQAVYARLHALAHELCEGRWVATGGGGYQLVSVVPRAWTLAFGEMAEAELPGQIPEGWRRLATERTGEQAPREFREEPATVPQDVREQARAAAEEAVEACRSLVLSRHGG